jgi:hypothetical protein
MSYNRRSKVDFSVNRSTVFAVPMIANAISGAKPLRSLGLACHSRQVSEFNDFYRQHGIVGAHHDADGTCVLESRKARNEVLKARNLRDNDAGYGDWSGNT